MRRLLVSLAATCIGATATPAHAWGYDAHQLIMDRAIALLPVQLRPFFEQNRATLVERSIDPDVWQVAGFNDREAPNHFLDLDWEGYGKYPFSELPRDYSAAVAKFGKQRIEQNGTLPWRVEEIYGSLRRSFESGPAPRPLRTLRHHVLLGVADPLHQRRACAVPCRLQL